MPRWCEEHEARICDTCHGCTATEHPGGVCHGG